MTGGTTGITFNTLKKWAPFTPSFINRAEDQAFVISSINKNKYLSHLHSKNLLMRHDKLDFTKRSIDYAKAGKEIGNLERILLFSYYSKCSGLNFKQIKNHLWPYTSSFIQEFPETLIYLTLMIDGISKNKEFLVDASERLKNTQKFCKYKLDDQFIEEKDFWNMFIQRIDNFKDAKIFIRDLIINCEITFN